MSKQLVDQIPEWLDREAWEAFKRMRKAKGSRAPFTQDAERRMLLKLNAMRQSGHDIAAVLWQSVEMGWSGVFPVKTQDDANGDLKAVKAEDATAQLLAAQAAHRKASQQCDPGAALARMQEVKRRLKAGLST